MKITRLETVCLSRLDEPESQWFSARFRTIKADCAVGGIDAALWDIRGKVAGKAVCRLLSDRPLNRVRLYASGGCRYDWRDQPEQPIEEGLGHVGERSRGS